MKTALLVGTLFLFPLAATAQFTAYNDFVTNYVTGATNVTQNQNAGTYALKDYATGATVTPTMTITRAVLSINGTGPTAEISGGDALTIFGGKVAGLGQCMAPGAGWYFNMEFSGLDVNKTYDVATFTDRGSASYDNKRWANISLVNADSTTFTYACSVGVGNYKISDYSVSQDSGYNTTEGFVAKWTGIAPGPDGKFSIYFRPATTAEVPAAYQAGMSQNSGYGPAGLMLQENAAAAAVTIAPAQINSVVGAANVSGTVSIPAGSNASAAVQVTLTSSDAAVADLVGATGGVLVLTFPQGGATEQPIQIDIGQVGSATIASTNGASLLDDTLSVNVSTGAVTLAPTSITYPLGALRPVVVSLSPGANDTRAVNVTLTSSDPTVANPIGSIGGVLVLNFPQGGGYQQTVNVQLGAVGSATIDATNDGGLTNPSTLPVTVQTGAVTLNPGVISTLPGSVKPVAVSISAGANDTRAIQVTLTSNNPAVADMTGATGGILALTFAPGAATQQTVNVQLGSVVGETTTIGVANDGGLTNPNALSVAVVNLRSWIVPLSELQGTWTKELTGGYDDGGVYTGTYRLDGRYYWRLWTSGNVWERVYWRFDAADVPSQPRLYTIEEWVPYLGADDPRSWKQMDSYINGAIGEGTTYNSDMIPRNGHNQWIKKGQLDLTETESGWKPAGPGPNAPDGTGCAAGSAGSYFWLKKGSELYMDGDASKPLLKYGVSALRITEVTSITPVCDPAVSDGALDLRCIGNADPLYTIGEGFGRGNEAHVNGDALAVEGYQWPCHSPTNANITPLVSGLPYDATHPEYATYVAQMPLGEVSFKLRYDGFNSLKWRNDTTGDFSKEREFILNGVPDRDFIPGGFNRMYILSTKASGNTGKLRVEKIYSDGPTEVTETNLWDWDDEDGAGDSVTVGVDGRLRSVGTDVLGFTRINNWGLAPGGWGGTGNPSSHSKSFLCVHTIEVTKSKTLTQVKLSVGDQALFGGELCVLAVTLEGGGCYSPRFDMTGPDGVPDGAVDQLDFAIFQTCYSRDGDPDVRFSGSQCGCMDADGDKDVDEADFIKFAQCAAGPGVAANPACDD